MIAAFQTREQPVLDGYTPVRLSLVEGAVYHFLGIEGKSGEKVGWVVPPGEYRLVGVGRHVHSGQELVAYRCLADNKLFFCTLSDWEQKFVAPALPLPEPEGPPVERQAGLLGLSTPPNSGGEQ